jgi:hypothetical protein
MVVRQSLGDGFDGGRCSCWRLSEGREGRVACSSEADFGGDGELIGGRSRRGEKGV